MKAVDITLMITGDQAPEWTCSAVWGGKMVTSAREAFLGSPMIWRSSAVWGSRALWMSNTIQPGAVLRTSAVSKSMSAQGPGSKNARGAN